MSIPPTAAFVLHESELEELTRFVRSIPAWAGLVQRARIVLLAAAGLSNAGSSIVPGSRGR